MSPLHDPYDRAGQRAAARPGGARRARRGTAGARAGRLGGDDARDPAGRRQPGGDAGRALVPLPPARCAARTRPGDRPCGGAQEGGGVRQGRPVQGRGDTRRRERPGRVRGGLQRHEGRDDRVHAVRGHVQARGRRRAHARRPRAHPARHQGAAAARRSPPALPRAVSVDARGAGAVADQAQGPDRRQVGPQVRVPPAQAAVGMDRRQDDRQRRRPRRSEGGERPPRDHHDQVPGGAEPLLVQRGSGEQAREPERRLVHGRGHGRRPARPVDDARQHRRRRPSRLQRAAHQHPVRHQPPRPHPQGQEGARRLDQDVRGQGRRRPLDQPDRQPGRTRERDRLGGAQPGAGHQAGHHGQRVPRHARVHERRHARDAQAEGRRGGARGRGQARPARRPRRRRRQPADPRRARVRARVRARRRVRRHAALRRQRQGRRRPGDPRRDDEEDAGRVGQQAARGDRRGDRQHHVRRERGPPAALLDVPRRAVPDHARDRVGARAARGQARRRAARRRTGTRARRHPAARPPPAP